MSGIAGIIHFDGAPIEPGLIEKMTAAMSHRGPDGIRHWQNGSVALGHCMLHSTQESLEEIQPLFSDDGRYVLVMDGRLDNWEELRRRCELHGCRLRNRSDAELVMQAFRLWGIDGLRHIEGDFALVVWDKDAKKVHCVRDRMGSKPFHYYWNGKTLAFASEVKALLQLPWIPKVCNEAMLVDYFMAHWCTKNDTLWREIWRLPQAHRLEIDAQHFQLSQYWQPELNELLAFSSDEEYAECYRSLFVEAVRRTSRSNQTVAFEVSGGLDSSALFAVADHLQQTSKLPAPNIEAYTLFFPDNNDANELKYARAVGEHLSRKIHEITPTQPSLEWLRQWAEENCEFPPYPNASMLIGIREQARQQGCKSLLVGIGGDEWLIAGRSYYAEEIQALRWHSLAQSWAADKRDYGIAKSLWWFARFGLLPLLPQRLKTVLRKPFAQQHAYADADMSWLSPAMQAIGMKRRQELHAELPKKFKQIGQRSKWHMTFSPTNCFAREAEERMAAMSGLELRWPFFNLQLAQFAFASPDCIRRRGRTDKFVHRRAMKDFLPDIILKRESKADFMLTYQNYLRGMETILCHEIPLKRQYWLDKEKLAAMYQLTQQGPTVNGMPEWQLWGLFGCDAVCV
jgi:asparagine synthase (glutamine-hydrolysing)